MTTPPSDGSIPGQPPGYPPGPQYGQPPGYPGAQYGQPPGYPGAPGFPGGGYGMPMAARRPSMVTAAAVLAFIWGAFAIIVGLGIVAARAVISNASAYCESVTPSGPVTTANCNAVSTYSSGFKVITAGLIIVAILLIWGGVVALTGKNGQILVVGAGLYILLEIVALIIRATSEGRFNSTGIIGIVAPILMLVFMLNPAAKAWFRSKGAKTF